MAKLVDRLGRIVEPRDEAPLDILLSKSSNTKKSDRRLRFQCEALLSSVGQNSCLNITQRAKSLNWYSDKLDRAKRTLLERELIEEIAITVGNGRPSKYLILSEKGKQYLKSMREKFQDLHGSFEHHCYIQKLKRRYEETYKSVLVDKQLDNYWPDLFCQDEDQGIVEVILSDHVKGDFKKTVALIDRVDWIHFYFLTEQIRNKYRDVFMSEFPPAIASQLTFWLLT